LQDFYETFATETILEEPTSYCEVVVDEKWMKAMHQEIDSIKKDFTWEIVDRL
jgi:hypothetical protein